MSTALGLMLLGATVAIHAEDVGEVDAETRAAVLAELALAIELRTGHETVLDEDSSSCVATDACVAAIQSRTSALDLLLLRLIAGPLRLRVVAERSGPGAEQTRPVTTDLRRGDPRRAALERLVASLFPPRVIDEPALSVSTAPPRDEKPAPWGAIAAVASGVALAGTGVALALSSASAIDRLKTSPHPPDEFDALSDRAGAHGLAANVLFVAAAGSIAAGVILLLDGIDGAGGGGE